MRRRCTRKVPHIAYRAGDTSRNALEPRHDCIPLVGRELRCRLEEAANLARQRWKNPTMLPTHDPSHDVNDAHI